MPRASGVVSYKSGPIYKILKYQEEWTLSRMEHLYLLMVVWVQHPKGGGGKKIAELMFAYLMLQCDL
jgi:hypothetical protein